MENPQSALQADHECYQWEPQWLGGGTAQTIRLSDSFQEKLMKLINCIIPVKANEID